MDVCVEYWVSWNADQRGLGLGYHLCVGPGGGSPDSLLFPGSANSEILCCP